MTNENQDIKISEIARCFGIGLAIIAFAIVTILIATDYYHDTGLAVAYQWISIALLLVVVAGPGFTFYRAMEKVKNEDVEEFLTGLQNHKGEPLRYPTVSSFFGDMALIGLFFSKIGEVHEKTNKAIINLFENDGINLIELALLSIVVVIFLFLTVFVSSILASTTAKLFITVRDKSSPKYVFATFFGGLGVIIISCL
ncbi:hypothetical protein GTH32_04705 [Alteromonas sp. 345S023]|uniref:Uncharacterized protein n=1 Tax=Alteromonas profundi TaxID=2696062 RepID=A0A7X5RK09_9ALTE|nr:hypothetical protein [Alteromonas profundi]NDV90498.1 hypothetical protein [Alteromonas profundi]